MAAKQRLQELFAKYDTSGDGVLSEEEMTAATGIRTKKQGQNKGAVHGNNLSETIMLHMLLWL